MLSRITLIILLVTMAQSQSPAQSDRPKFFSADDLSSVVVFLVQDRIETVREGDEEFEVWLSKPGSGKFTPKLQRITGTALFLADEQRLFLATASHVAKQMSASALAILRGPKDEPIKLKLTDLSGSAPYTWKYHPEADVAVLNLQPSQAIVQSYLQKRFLPTYILEDSLKAPARELPLTIVGFPLGLGTEEHFSPLTLQTRSSSGLLQLNRFDNGILSTFFICENPSIGGYSGAPCFDISIYKLGGMTTTGEGTKCYGLMHGTISDQTGGKLAAVVPSKFILDIIK